MSDSKPKVPEHRMAGFKNRGSLKPEELRRRRDEVAVEIRRQKKEDSAAKRRNMNTPIGGSLSESEDESLASTQVSQVSLDLCEGIEVMLNRVLLPFELAPRASSGHGARGLLWKCGGATASHGTIQKTAIKRCPTA